MPLYEFEFKRKVYSRVVVEEWANVEIEADNEDEAIRKAKAMQLGYEAVPWEEVDREEYNTTPKLPSFEYLGELEN